MLGGAVAHAQTVPLGLLENIDDQYRRLQLLGRDTTGNSFTVRPLTLPTFDNGTGGDSFYAYKQLLKPLFNNSKLNIQVYALPVVLQQQYNFKAPYGMNDNSMVQSRGYQASISAGMFLRWGPLSVQLYPEYVYAQNKSFLGPESNVNESGFQKAYATYIYNKIDNPSSFGESAYNKFSWGQSSVRLTFNPISLGLSNENLWWGPGIKNALLMSNTASGFKHLTLNTTKPVDIYLGKIEGQMIAGKLESSGIGLPSTVRSEYRKYYTNKPDDWRYFSGFIFTYQPKWIPNLFLGIDRSFIIYRKDMGKTIGDYLPIFTALEKQGGVNRETNVYQEDLKKRDQYLSVFARWVMPESKAELYAEFGRNDHAYNIRDLLSEPEHSRAYILGFRKLFALRSPDEYIQFGFEMTQLELSKTSNIRPTESWYSHYQVTDGYTNRGQILGAGIGPGSNIQSTEVSWVKGMKKIGFTLDRLVHDNDFLYNTNSSVTEVRRHWIDFAFGANFGWDFNRFIVNSNLTYIRTLNNQWLINNDGSFYWDIPKVDTNNLHVKVGLAYRW